METKYTVRQNIWGNVRLYRGRKAIGVAWSESHFPDEAVKSLKAEGHELVRIDGELISHDLGAYTGWKAIADATLSPASVAPSS